MPSFSRATLEMRCSFAAWAISISDGMGCLLVEAGFSLPAARRGLDSNQVNPLAEARADRVGAAQLVIDVARAGLRSDLVRRRALVGVVDHAGEGDAPLVGAHHDAQAPRRSGDAQRRPHMP